MVKIRQAAIQDKGVLKNFQLQMAWETERLQLDQAVLDQGLENVLTDPSKGKYFLAEDKSNVIAGLMVTPEWSDWRNGTVWWIQSVYVINEYRRKGVYKKLYEHVKKWISSEESYKGIRLYVEKDNIVAQQVYTALGMDGEHYRLFEWMKS
jgi:GNAT superfamily N-acetyltransferase